MKRSSPFRLIVAIGLLMSVYTSSINALCCRNFVSDIICSVLNSELLIESKLDIIESIADQIIPNLPDIFSSIEEINALDTAILVNLTSILEIMIIDTVKANNLLHSSNSIVDESSFILSLNEEINQTTNTTCSINELIHATLVDVLNDNMIILSILDEINNELSIINSQIDLISNPCSAIPILGPTTISTAGYYCVANDIMDNSTQAAIGVATNNVTLDLNQHIVSNTGISSIQINANLSNVKIQNGSVSTPGSIGLAVASGCNNVIVENIHAINCRGGINFNGTGNPISDCVIRNCTSDSHTNNGLVLNTCRNILVETSSFSNGPSTTTMGCNVSNSETIQFNQVIVSLNGQSGFNLTACNKCVFRECKALNNGFNNPGGNNSTGFISTNGSGNIFENCIANGTTINDADDSVFVAGFALLGTESCSKIIGCESANAFAPFATTGQVDYGSIPYGILLQSSLVPSLTNPTNQSFGFTAQTAQWSPDGNYLAVGGGSSTSNQLKLYQFDYATRVLTLITQATYNGVSAGTINSLNWSPDGKYLAVGGSTSAGNQIIVYQFNPLNNTLTANTPTTFNSAVNAVFSLNWSPDGRYLAAGGQNSLPGGTQIIVYQFNPLNNALTINAQASYYSNTAFVNAVEWSPNGQFLAVTGFTDSAGGQTIIYSFSPGSLTPNTPTVYYNPNNTVNTLNWSPNGLFLAVGGLPQGGQDSIIIYQFDPTSVTLSINTSAPFGKPAESRVKSVKWSANSIYLLVGGDPASGGNDQFVIYTFNPVAPSLNLTISAVFNSLTNIVNAVTWSPSGNFVAGAGDGTNQIQIYQAMNFPTNNVIKDNIVWCNNGGSTTQPNGVGISGSNASNLIINNTSYCNNGFNYQFVTSPAIFNPLFNWVPSDLQNISVACGAPIPATFNLQQQLNFINAELSKLNVVNNQISDLDTVASTFNFTAIESQLITIASQTDYIAAHLPYLCNSLSITAAATISSAGIYCLANNISGSITINSNNVSLDLSGHVITSTAASAVNVTANRNRINITNGQVVATNGDGIRINSGDEEVIIRKITAQNSVRGINITGANNIIIDQCDFVSNTTGLEISSTSNAINATNCTAIDNTQAGYYLSNSTRNYIADNKALHNGSGSASNGYGFVSSGCSGNIFERNIVEYTTTNTTGWLTAAAGFALLDGENCARIINCTSSNNAVPSITAFVNHTFTSTTGGSFTTTHTLVESAVPYGILLGSTLQSTNSMLTTYTGANIGAGATSDVVSAVGWSPDNRFIIAGGLFPTSNRNLSLLAFDPSNSNTLITQYSLSTGGNSNDQVLAVDWSPNNKFVAIGTKHVTNTIDIQVYYYDIAKNLTPLTLVSSVSTNTATANSCYAVRWSPNNQYLAAGGFFGGTFSPLRIYSFNPLSNPALINLNVTTADITSTSTIYSIDWSPNGNYIAVGGAITGNGPTDRVHIYSFNASSSPILTKVTSIDPGTADTQEATHAVRWSPDGNYLATGGNIVPVSVVTTTTIINTSFVTTTSTLANSNPISIPSTGAATPYPSTVQFDGSFIISGASLFGIFGFTHPSPDDVEILLVSPSGQSVLLMNNVGDNISVSNIDILWSNVGSTLLPCGTGPIISSNLMTQSPLYVPTDCGGGTNFIPPAPSGPYSTSLSSLVGTDAAGTWSLYVYDDTATGSGSIFNPNAFGPGQGASWAFQLATTITLTTTMVITTTTSATQNLKLYAFQPTTTPALLQIGGASVNSTAPSINDTINSISWSGNEQYLAVGGQFTQDFRLFSFNPQLNNALTQVTANNPGNGNNVAGVAWSPDGTTIVIGGQLIPASPNELLLYNALSFPQNNIIQNNTVFCNTNGSTTFPAGVGISGSSIFNLILNNLSYNNPFNYIFVANTFSQLFESVPSSLENVGIAAFEPILNPDTIGLNIINIENLTLNMTNQMTALFNAGI